MTTKRCFLVTGGAGFIGSHLADRLIAHGNDVIVIDDLSTGSIANIDHLKTRDGFTCVIDSVFNRPVLAELVDRCDYVVHLAAAVGVKLIVERPVHTIETNVRGTEVVLDLANRRKRPVLIASTSEVYGKAQKIPFSEDDDVLLGPSCRSRWAYACSKLIDEFLTLAYHQEKGLPVVIARLFNTVGPRQTGRYGMVVPTFVQQALSNRPITVYGDGTQSRCFGYVGDVVWALEQLITREEAYGQVFNVGAQEEITIADLARKVRTQLGSSSEIVYVPYEEAYAAGFEDMPRRVPDISRLQQLTGFKPRATLTDIIDSVADGLVEHRELAELTGISGGPVRPPSNDRQ